LTTAKRTKETKPGQIVIIHKEESYAVMGACFEVYKNKGPGFVEPIYHECLEIEFGERNLPAVSKPKLQIEYKGIQLKHGPEPDFVCFGKIILEIKAVKTLCDEHWAQLMNYLKSTGFELGLLVNFCGSSELQWERIVKTRDSSPQDCLAKNPPTLQR
jgi:GxxExxY protein